MWRAVVSQPFARNSTLEARGDIDKEAGEFWVENPFMMPEQGHNLSAFESNRLFLNAGGRDFIDVSFASNADIDSDSRAAITADFDGDHDEDLLVGNIGGGPLRLFRNDFPSTGHRIRLQLKGTTSNRSGIGSRITLKLSNGQTIVRDIFTPSGFRGQAPVPEVIGVGEATTIEMLTIRWPNGTLQEFGDISVDQLLVVTESQATFERLPLSGRND